MLKVKNTKMLKVKNKNNKIASKGLPAITILDNVKK